MPDPARVAPPGPDDGAVARRAGQTDRPAGQTDRPAAGGASGSDQPGRGERLGFAVGDVFMGGASSLISVLYLIFLTDVVGLRPGLAGSVVLVAKVWDAVNDPLMGALSDRTRTRWGRRRPFMVVGAILLVPAMALLWLPQVPATGQLPMFVWAVASYVLYATVQTVMAVPYSSLSTEIATDYDVRNRANTLRLLLSTVSSAVCSLLATALFEAYRSGDLSATGLYLGIVLGVGAVLTACVLVSALVSRERTPLPTSVQSVSLRTFTAPLRLRTFRRLLGMYLSHSLALDIITTTLLYYTLYVVTGVSTQVVLGIFIAVNVVAYPIVTALVGRVSKVTVYRTLLPLGVVAALGVALYPASWPAWGVYAVALLLATGMAGAQLMPWVMFGDVVDDADLATGRRDAGSFSGMMTFVRGLATAVVVQVIGLVLELTGYVAPADNEVVEQSDATQWGIRLVLGIGVAGMLLAGRQVARDYSISRERALATADELASRRAGGVEAS
ncbi:MFS transporter [Georgenia sp. Z1344]|uniref:MFS transporter n=1 Tax=Georgenia sp. Z1344 TaxID=3416706 RepID=UPI003CEA0A8F